MRLPDVVAWPGSELSPREVLWLIQHLPPDSAARADALGGTQFRGWRIDTFLLAAIVDMLQAANYQRGGGKGPEPKPVPRPGGKQKSRGTPLAALKPPRRG